MYHSHADEVRDLNAGLMGPMIIHARGAMTTDGRPPDVDRELVVAFTEFDENESWYIEEALPLPCGAPHLQGGMTSVFTVLPSRTAHAP